LSGALDRDPLDLIERDFVASPIIELGRARAFVRRHHLRVLQPAAGFQIGGDARGAEGMAADPHDGMVIGLPGVLVADGCGEELQKLAAGMLAGTTGRSASTTIHL
jgi:hypothetical protein